jgi:hypothetical protein
MCKWSTFGARTNREHTQTHKIPHSLNLGEVNTFPFIIFFMINHGGYIQMSFCFETFKLGVPKPLEIGTFGTFTKRKTCICD